MKHLTVDIESAAYAECNGERDVDTRNFAEVCRELGITYERMKGIAMAGKVYLYNCKIPENVNLPKYWSYGIDSFILNQYFGGARTAAPQQECKHEFVYGWHSYGSKSGYQCRFCGKFQEVK